MDSQLGQGQEAQRASTSADVGDEKGRIFIAGAMVHGKVDMNTRKGLVELSTIEKGVREQTCPSWVFRFNRVIANWYGMQLGIIQ
jgi:hypothetical protein